MYTTQTKLYDAKHYVYDSTWSFKQIRLEIMRNMWALVH